MRIQHQHDISIPLGPVTLRGDLAIPASAPGLVLFSHGSGSSRHSPRNRLVAERLQRSQWATLLVDLLTEREDGACTNRFDIELLTGRLLGVTRWARHHVLTAGLPVGYFGASTGAASALRAAAELGPEIHAVVSRGGRPDLAGEALGRVVSPTLLIVGGRDPEVLALNRRAYELLPGIKQLEVVPGATHLFEERGALEEVADLAAAWFVRHMPWSEDLHAMATASPSPERHEEKPWGS